MIQPVLTWHAFSIGEAAKASFSSSVSSIHDFIIILSIILLNKAPSSWTIAHPVSYFDTHTHSHSLHFFLFLCFNCVFFFQILGIFKFCFSSLLWQLCVFPSLAFILEIIYRSSPQMMPHYLLLIISLLYFPLSS